MGLFRKVGKGAGELFGTVVGGTVKFAGELTGSKFIEDVGDGVKNASTFAGDSIGQAADGVWNTASGMIQDDEDKINRGVDDIGGSVGRTAKGIGTTIKNTAEQGYNAYNSFKTGDSHLAKESLKSIGKTAAIGILAVGVVDLADGADSAQASESANSQVSGESIGQGTQISSENSALENPGTHHVDPHYVEGYTRADGTYVEGYWRDGDGDTSVNHSIDDGGGYLRTDPDGNPTNNLG